MQREQEGLLQPRAQTRAQQSPRSDTAAAGSFGLAGHQPNLGSSRCGQVCHLGWGAAPNRNGAACGDLEPYPRGCWKDQGPLPSWPVPHRLVSSRLNLPLPPALLLDTNPGLSGTAQAGCSAQHSASKQQCPVLATQARHSPASARLVSSTTCMQHLHTTLIRFSLTSGGRGTGSPGNSLERSPCLAGTPAQGWLQAHTRSFPPYMCP